MTARPTLDFESFQKLLSNAFVVQESAMDTHSLSVIVELQGLIAAGELSVDGAMDQIAGRAQSVANAAGIVIGLMQGDQLVYRAGSGSAAGYVGQRVMATLSVSAQSAGGGEILRVENSQTDKRIEAAICRQFGAQSLLILPIYHGAAVVGVLNVLFDEPHAFQQREVRSYRMMAGLVGEAMSYAARPAAEKSVAVDLPAMRSVVEPIRPQIAQIRAPIEKTLPDAGSSPGAVTNRAIYMAYGNTLTDAGKVSAFRQSARTTSKRVARMLLYMGPWKTAVAVAAVLAIVFSIAYRNRRPPSQEASAPPTSKVVEQQNVVVEQQSVFAPVKPVLASTTPTPPANLDLQAQKPKAAKNPGHWVRVGKNELDHVNEDVTVRYFKTGSEPHPVLAKKNQVRRFSDDVTVRYFAPKPAGAPAPAAARAAQSMNR